MDRYQRALEKAREAGCINKKGKVKPGIKGRIRNYDSRFVDDAEFWSHVGQTISHTVQAKENRAFGLYTSPASLWKLAAASQHDEDDYCYYCTPRGVNVSEEGHLTSCTNLLGEDEDDDA